MGTRISELIQQRYKMLTNAGTPFPQLVLIAVAHRKRITQRINEGENTAELHEARAFLKKKINLWASILYEDSKINPLGFDNTDLTEMKLVLEMMDRNFQDTDSISNNGADQ